MQELTVGENPTGRNLDAIEDPDVVQHRTPVAVTLRVVNEGANVDRFG